MHTSHTGMHTRMNMHTNVHTHMHTHRSFEKVTARSISELSLLSSEVCTNTYAGGTVAEGASGMEMTTKLGAATGSGTAAALGPCSLGHSGTMRTRHSTGGTLKDFVAAPVNMTFLGSYFSQVTG